MSTQPTSVLTAAWPLAAHWYNALRTSGLAQRRDSHIRATVREERTLDDELGDIYGPVPSIVSPSAESRTSQAAVERRTSFAPSLGIGNMLEQEQTSRGTGIPLASQALFDTSPNSLPTSVPTETQVDPLFSPGQLMFDVGGQADSLFDTLGDDLSAFLQAGVPNSQVDMGSSWFWEA